VDLLKIRKKARAQKEAEEAREKEARQGSEEPGDEAERGRERPVPADDSKTAGSLPQEEAAATVAADEPPAGSGDEPPAEEAPIPEDEEAPEAPAEALYVEYLSFMLSGEEYAVRIEDVKEIIRWQSITRVPRAPSFVMGVISLRGVIMPVFDIKRRLGLGEAERSRFSRVLVVEDGGSLVGMMVDRVTGVVKLGPESIEPPPSVIGGVEAGYLEGVGRVGERLVILFDTPRVLSMEE
jgi:purine-binding chemotaxis protein CheW